MTVYDYENHNTDVVSHIDYVKGVFILVILYLLDFLYRKSSLELILE